MPLIKTKEELATVVPVMADMKIDKVIPFFKYVEQRFIKDILGKTLFDSLTSTYDAGTADEALLAQVQAAVANLGVFFAIPVLNVGLSNEGLIVSKSQSTSPASQVRTEDLKRTVRDLGFRSLDFLIEFLIESDQGSSAVLDKRKTSFIQNAKDFNSIIDIDSSHFMFLKLTPFIDEVEDNIILDILGESLFDTIKVSLGTVEGPTEHNLKLVPKIKKVLANYAFADAVPELRIKVDDRGITMFNNETTQTVVSRKPSETLEMDRLVEGRRGTGDYHKNKLLKYLHDNIDNYPLFMESESYVEDSTGTPGGALTGDGFAGFM